MPQGVVGVLHRQRRPARGLARPPGPGRRRSRSVRRGRSDHSSVAMWCSASTSDVVVGRRARSTVARSGSSRSRAKRRRAAAGDQRRRRSSSVGGHDLDRHDAASARGRATRWDGRPPSSTIDAVRSTSWRSTTSPQRGAQRVDVERAPHAGDEREVVGVGALLDLLDQPQPLLGGRQRQHGRARAGHQRRPVAVGRRRVAAGPRRRPGRPARPRSARRTRRGRPGAGPAAAGPGPPAWWPAASGRRGRRSRRRRPTAPRRPEHVGHERARSVALAAAVARHRRAGPPPRPAPGRGRAAPRGRACRWRSAAGRRGGRTRRHHVVGQAGAQRGPQVVVVGARPAPPARPATR